MKPNQVQKVDVFLGAIYVSSSFTESGSLLGTAGSSLILQVQSASSVSQNQRSALDQAYFLSWAELRPARQTCWIAKPFAQVDTTQDHRSACLRQG